ncbi:MAG: hypothetical protein AMJ93_10575 [Anaerolineae bacterium SM23_84]|nr:MAG: hypothetical protein AMJ93_10575 [Anaerolineae bacterium SM23_84]
MGQSNGKMTLPNALGTPCALRSPAGHDGAFSKSSSTSCYILLAALPQATGCFSFATEAFSRDTLYVFQCQKASAVPGAAAWKWTKEVP